MKSTQHCKKSRCNHLPNDEFRNFIIADEEFINMPNNTTTHSEIPLSPTVQSNYTGFYTTIPAANPNIQLNGVKEQIVIPLSNKVQLRNITVGNLRKLGSTLRNQRQYQFVLVLTSEGVFFLFRFKHSY